MILMESPGSLSFEMQDMARVAELARARGILSVADNTWGAGYLYKPLDHGVDIAVQALTKYVGGHSDVFMGSAAARDPKLVRALEDGIMHLGWAVTGEDAYQMLRGLRTLPTRLARHGESGLAVAAWLAGRPEVAQVYHPALPGCPDHALWKRDYTGACGLFALALQPGPQAAVNAFLDELALFGLGFSWGGFESLAVSCDHQLKTRRLGHDYGGPLIRLHVGLENPDDLIADLRRGLEVYAARAA
jgi:cysteine-S-conjugate beta-lyase